MNWGENEMNKTRKWVIGSIVVLIVLLLLLSVIVYLVKNSRKMPENNEFEQFSVQPMAYIGFDDADSVSHDDLGAELVEGFSGKGVELASALDNAVVIDQKGFAKEFNGAETITVSMWVMPYVHRVSTRLFTIYLDSVNEGVYADYVEDKIVFYARSYAGEKRKKVTFDYNLDDGTMGVLNFEHTNAGVWQNLIFKVDFAANEMTLYVNGKEIRGMSSREEAADFGKDKFMCANPRDMVIGCSSEFASYPFNGIMDEVFVFNKKLSEEDYQVLYNREAETKGSVADQKYIEEAIQYMQDSVIFAKDKDFYISNGKMEQISYSDYALTATWDSNECYIPKETAKKLFGVEASDVISLKEIQEKTGREVLYFNEYNVAVVCAKEVSFETEEARRYIERLSKFFTDSRIRLPEMDAEVSRVVVDDIIPNATSYLGTPSICRLGDYLYMSYDCLSSTYIERSADNGQTWEKCGTVLRLYFGTLFTHDDKLYIIGTVSYNNKVYVGISRSEDNGTTWTAMDDKQGILFDKEEAHTSATPVVKHEGYIYKAFEFNPYDTGKRLASVISAKENADLLDPASWTIANGVKFTSKRFSMAASEDVTIKDTSSALLEGNVVIGRDGEVYNILRVQSQPYYDYATVTKLSPDRKTLGIDEVIDFYGGKTKFTIRYDESIHKYISFVNTVEDVHLSEQRNVLALVTSEDMYHWEIESYVLADRTLMNYEISVANHGYQYVDWIFSGDDILLAVREATDGADNFHNANNITVYTLKDYKSWIAE